MMYCVIRIADDATLVGINRDGTLSAGQEEVDCFFWEAAAMEVAREFGGQVVRIEELELLRRCGV